jgi:hypothetical protein
VSNELSAIRATHEAMLLDTATGTDLDVIGNNHGIPRPVHDDTDDVMYSNLIQMLAWQPKMIKWAVYRLMEIVYGTQASISPRPWRIYEPNPNEIVVELPTTLIATSNVNASYLHGWSGFAMTSSGPTDTFTAVGDVRTASATTLVGADISVQTADHTWTIYTILAASYNAGTNLSTVQVSAATIPAGGGGFFILIPGDGVSSSPGDMISSSQLVSTFTTAIGGPTTTITVFGDVSETLTLNHTIQLTYGVTNTTVVVSTVTYVPATNTSTVVLTATVPGSLSGIVVKLLDVADGTAVPHDKRVYLTGLGLFEIVQQYLDLFVRAAGIVVRVEQI